MSMLVRPEALEKQKKCEATDETQGLAKTHLLLFLEVMSQSRLEALPRLADVSTNKITDLATGRLCANGKPI